MATDGDMLEKSFFSCPCTPATGDADPNEAGRGEREGAAAPSHERGPGRPRGPPGGGLCRIEPWSGASNSDEDELPFSDGVKTPDEFA